MKQVADAETERGLEKLSNLLRVTKPVTAEAQATGLQSPGL